ncbi:MAG: purine-nucleoside phosphorylase [Solirubrobacteraceae bacterium]|nr:purine-nucleoside phosphorylase [Solirubrobacteraceae bacterium]
MADPIHLHPTEALAERVLLPGDPGRALLLAQALLDKPKMFNHNRGLWGYSGVAADGAPLTIQSTGMGGPSAAIIITELHELGARRMLRVGTCGGLDSGLALGELLIATEAIAQDGTSQALGADSRAPAGAELLSALCAAGGERVRSGPVVSTDLFYDTASGTEEGWRTDGALAVEMEAAALFTIGARRGFEAGAVLVVSDLVLPERRRIGLEELRAAEHALGNLALGALAV